MTRTQRLRAEDYETLLRIVGELGELPPDPLLRRRHALTRLAEAFGCRAGLFAHTGWFDGAYGLRDVVTIGLDDAPKDLLARYCAGDLEWDPCCQPMEAAPRTLHNHVALRDQLIDDATWYRSTYFNENRRHFRVDHAVYSRVLADNDGSAYGICLLRELGARPLTERHRRMLHVFNEHAKRLYRLGEPIETSPLAKLAPRLRPVAERFLAGDSAKQAARHLGLSVHTVAEYSKAIYRTYNVSSRAELLLALMNKQSPR